MPLSSDKKKTIIFGGARLKDSFEVHLMEVNFLGGGLFGQTKKAKVNARTRIGWFQGVAFNDAGASFYVGDGK